MTRFDKISNYYFSFSIYLLPFSLLTGPFLPDLLVSLSAVYFLFYAYAKKLSKYFFNKFFYIFLLFYLLIIISSLVSAFPTHSLESSLPYIRFIILSLIVWYLCDSNKNFAKNFFYTLLMVYLFALTDGFFQYSFGKSIFGFVSTDNSRMVLPFNDKLILGGYLARLAPLLIAFYILFSNKSFYSYLFLGLILVAIDCLVFMTGERTALAFMLITTIFILLFLKEFRLLRICTFVISLLVIFFISIFNTDIKERNFDTTLNQIGVNDDAKGLYYLSEKHESLLITGYKIFLDNPLLGVGPNGYRKSCDSSMYSTNSLSCSTHPHNNVIQILAELGLLGFIFYLIIIFYISYQIFNLVRSFLLKRGRNLSDYQICLVGCFIISLWPILPSNNFFNNWINIIYYLPVGFYLYSLTANNKFSNKE